jgi:capsular exopolysaccharide synthesis family protein
MNTIVTPERPDPPIQESARLSPLPIYLDQNELREAVRKIWRRRVLILATMAFVTALGAVRLYQIPPRYVASTMLIIDPRPNSVMSVEAMLAGGSRDAEAVYTEATVLTSRQLIDRLVGKLKLEADPEFNGALQPASLWQVINPLNLIPDDWRAALKGAPVDASPERQREALRDGLIDAVVGHLEITPKPRTRILTVTFSSTSPETAALVANTLADLYLVNQLEAKFEATQRVANWLDQQLNDLRKKVDVSDRAVQEYRAHAGLLGGKGAAPVEQQVSELTTQLTVARTERAATEAKLRSFSEALAGRGQQSLAAMMDSPMIQHLREQESEVQRSIADLSAQYGERHPKLIAARGHLEDIEARIREEAKKQLMALDNSANVARTREAVVAGQIEDLKKKVASWNASEVQLRALEMESAANRTLMETFLSQFKQTSAQEKGGIQTPDARIISRASVPGAPSSPNKTSFMGTVIIVSGLAGIALALIAEYLDRGFRSGVQFEQHTGTPALAMIPAVPKDKGLPADYLMDHPISAYAEAIRSVYASILLSGTSEPLRTIVIASAKPKEGKSTLALSLVRLIASTGHKAVLVEADLRHPSIHTQLGIDRRAGLAEVLIGSASLNDVLFRDEKSSADILLAGAELPNPSKLIASKQMTELLTKLAEQYERIIIDTAPVLAVSDGWLLTNQADGTIFTCLWAATTRETADLGLKELREANARVIGAVLSAVDTRKIRSYGYADTAFHYSSRKYYSD